MWFQIVIHAGNKTGEGDRKWFWWQTSLDWQTWFLWEAAFEKRWESFEAASLRNIWEKYCRQRKQKKRQGLWNQKSLELAKECHGSQFKGRMGREWSGKADKDRIMQELVLRWKEFTTFSNFLGHHWSIQRRRMKWSDLFSSESFLVTE